MPNTDNESRKEPIRAKKRGAPGEGEVRTDQSCETGPAPQNSSVLASLLAEVLSFFLWEITIVIIDESLVEVRIRL